MTPEIFPCGKVRCGYMPRRPYRQRTRTRCGNYEKVSNIKGIKKITFNNDCTVFYCEGKGIAPSSQEYGFYYSKSNLPMANFDGKPVFYFEKDIGIGEGRKYTNDSYNSFYTEEITELFYYYDNNL